MNRREMARALGRRGGRMRARRLSDARKREIASAGGVARARSLLAARRIEENFRYLAAVHALQGGTPVEVVRQHRCDGPLPGIYRPKA